MVGTDQLIFRGSRDGSVVIEESLGTFVRNFAYLALYMTIYDVERL